MKLEQAFDVDVPAISIPESRVYGYRTRMSDFDTPDIERIIKPVSEIPHHVDKIRLTTGDSQTNVESHPIPDAPFDRLKHEVKRVLHRREPVIDLGDRLAIDMRYFFTGNYAHLIHDVLGPLRMIEHTLEQDPSLETTPIHVVLEKKASPLALRVLEFAGIPTILTDGAVRGRMVSVTQDLNVALLPHLSRQPFEAWPTPTPDRVLVSRRGARSILNEDAVMQFLAKDGFERVYMEDFSLSQQWTILGNASEVVGIHGAALSSLAFSVHRPKGDGPRFKLVELFSPGYFNNCFRLYSAVLGGVWVGVRGKITPEVVRDLDMRGDALAHQYTSFDVDLESLEEALTDVRSSS